MIKTIIFDFAGVITTTPIFPGVANIFGAKENICKETFYHRLKSEEKAYLLGKRSTREFWKRVCAGTNIGYAEFVEEISRYQLNMDVIRLMRTLKKRYELVLLSDNYDALYKRIIADKHLRGIFRHSFFSHKLHMVKMYDEEKIFLFVIEKLKIEPKECVFIDDKEINLAPAKKIGMNTIHFKDNAQLENDFHKLKVLF